MRRITAVTLRMNRVQEMIDERRHELPVGLAKELLEACRDEALYRITYTTVIAVPRMDTCDDEPTAEVELLSDTKTQIVELDTSPLPLIWYEFLRHGKLNTSWLSRDMPFTVHTGNMDKPTVIVVHSIVPLHASKRAREE